MVAVPAHWRTLTGPCGEPDGPVVHLPGRDAPHALLPTWCSLALVAPEAATSGSARATPGQAASSAPMVEHGTSVGRASGVLADAGLEPMSPDVDFPHYATGTRPAAGTIIAEGSTVSLTHRRRVGAHPAGVRGAGHGYLGDAGTGTT